MVNPAVRKATAILKKGGIVVYPTDTAYGLAVDATKPGAVKKLYQLKGRAFQNPVHVIFPDTNWLTQLVAIDPLVLKIMNRYMPGPLTLVLPMKIEGPSWELLSAGTKTLGVRLPDNKFALELVRNFGKPITATSANITGMANTYSPAEVRKQFEHSALKPDFYLDGGKLKKTEPSTVVKITGRKLEILREGPIKEKMIKKLLSS